MYIIYLTRNSSIFIDLGFFGHFRGSQHEGDEKEEDVVVKNGSGKIEEKRSWEGRRERERKGPSLSERK